MPERLDQVKVNTWAEENAMVQQHQIVEMVNIDGSNLFLGAESEKNSVMDIDFVTQNQGFDYLLNLDSEIIQVNDGKIAVPVYHMQQKKLSVGDQVAGSIMVNLSVTTPSLILSVMLR